MTNLRSGAAVTLEEERIISTRVGGRPEDRRDFPRYAIPNQFGVALRVLPSTDVVVAQIQNLSRDGVGLVTDVFIAPGESVTFPVGNDWVVADVRYCNKSDGHFSIGAMITDIVDGDESAKA